MLKKHLNKKHLKTIPYALQSVKPHCASWMMLFIGPQAIAWLPDWEQMLQLDESRVILWDWLFGVLLVSLVQWWLALDWLAVMLRGLGYLPMEQLA